MGYGKMAWKMFKRQFHFNKMHIVAKTLLYDRVIILSFSHRYVMGGEIVEIFVLVTSSTVCLNEV